MKTTSRIGSLKRFAACLAHWRFNKDKLAEFAKLSDLSPGERFERMVEHDKRCFKLLDPPLTDDENFAFAERMAIMTDGDPPSGDVTIRAMVSTLTQRFWYPIAVSSA